MKLKSKLKHVELKAELASSNAKVKVLQDEDELCEIAADDTMNEHE